MEALVPVAEAQTAVTTTHTALIEAQHKNYLAQCDYNEASQKKAHELAVRRAKDFEEIRQLQHRHEVNELIREEEVVERQTRVVHARVALADADQQLRAQNEHGYLRYELAHKRQALEILDVELSQADRRAIFREFEGRRRGGAHLDLEEEIEDALYDRRAKLNSAGLPTSNIDALLRDRKR
jgi:hypothetical protein